MAGIQVSFFIQISSNTRQLSPSRIDRNYTLVAGLTRTLLWTTLWVHLLVIYKLLLNLVEHHQATISEAVM